MIDAKIATALFDAGEAFTVYEWSDRAKRQYPRLAFAYRSVYNHTLATSFATYVNEAGEKLERGLLFALPFSSDIAAAMQVVEAMRAKGWPSFTLRYLMDWDGKLKWWCDFAPGNRSLAATADTPALAICLASLRALDFPELAQSASLNRET